MSKCKCLVLAAGYATRLYPLTENFPKPLLKVGGKTILDWLIDDIDSAGSVSEYIIVTNHKFADIFIEWAADKPYKIHIVDDMTSTNETRLGAVRDIQFAVKKLNIDDDLLVIAGDNLLDFSLARFVRYAEGKNTTCTMRYREPDINKIKKSGVSEVDSNDRLISFEEKPEYPKSGWATPPFYFYKREDLRRIDEAVKDGCGTDAPGSLVAWMCKHSEVYSMEMPGSRYDIGNIESYEYVKSTYKGITVK